MAQVDVPEEEVEESCVILSRSLLSNERHNSTRLAVSILSAVLDGQDQAVTFG